MTRLLTSFVVFLLFGLFLFINNHWITVSKHELYFDRLPNNFSGLKIVHLSDLHDANFGKGQSRLIKKIKNEKPDFIFFTGDLIDSNRYDLNKSIQAINELVEMAPVYYVTGNHEIATNEVDKIIKSLKSRGVTVLQNESEVIQRGRQKIVIGGIEDPLMRISEQKTEKKIVKSNIERTFKNVNHQSIFKLLLSHRPEYFNIYAQQDVDAVFSGHAHGGQIRIPFVGGLLSPGQGWFPTYTSGVYTSHSTNMIVSRGLGNSVIPIRVFNLPEIVVITLKSI